MLQRNDIRCGQCHRKLATGRYIELQIKCPRCGTLNHLKAESLLPERHRAIERLISPEMTMSDTPSIEHAPTWLPHAAGSTTRWQEG